MYLWRNTVLVKITLFFFTLMVFFNPAYAQQEAAVNYKLSPQINQNSFPVTPVSKTNAQRLFSELRRNGYVIKQGTLAQLEQMTQTNALPAPLIDDDNINIHENAHENSNENPDEKPNKNTDKEECQKASTDNKKEPLNNPPALVAKQVEQGNNNNGINSINNNDEQSALKTEQITNNKKDCDPEQTPTNDLQQQHLQKQSPQHDLDSSAQPAPSQPPATTPTNTAEDINIGVHADLVYSGSRGNSDLAKVFFILIGVVVVAVFVVYAGKYVVDMIKGDDYEWWREVTLNSTFMGTDPGQHGGFWGVKLATGFVSSEMLQVALVGEVGVMDVDLIINENTRPAALDFSGLYWMLGATVRLYLADKQVNPNYLYLEFMGGATDHSATELIGTSRFGASVGMNDYLRLGFSLGVQYIGLEESQGFVNDNDNYWFTYGLELGVRF